MKKIIKYIAPTTLICGLGLFLISAQNCKAGDPPHEVHNPAYVISMTKSIEVPTSVKFAGEKIELDRYDLYERFDREINAFPYLHSSTLLLIKKANRYFPIIEPILKKNGVPDDFKYLAVIESSLNHRIVSPAKAAGLWQFMPKTAPQYGLEVSDEVDERYSIEKSTEAACKYLKEAYKKYGKWSAVALAYNGGQGRISGELEKQNVEDALDLWLVEETTRYYFRMLAIKQVMEHPYKYGFVIEANQLYKPMKFKEVEVTSTIEDLASFAQEHGVTYAQLKDFNSWLRARKLTINEKKLKTYTILIPTEESLYYKEGEKIKVHNPNWIKHQ